MKEEKERSERELTKKIAEFKKHVQSQASQLWELNEKVIQLEQEKKKLEDKLLGRYAQESDKNQTFAVPQSVRHTLSVDGLDRIGQDTIPLINRARPDRQR